MTLRLQLQVFSFKWMLKKLLLIFSGDVKLVQVVKTWYPTMTLLLMSFIIGLETTKKYLMIEKKPDTKQLTMVWKALILEQIYITNFSSTKLLSKLILILVRIMLPMDLKHFVSTCKKPYQTTNLLPILNK